MLTGGFQALIVPSAAVPSRVEAANTANDQGVRLWQAGRRSEAVAQFDLATRGDARFAVPWHNRGAIYLIEGQFTQAIRELTRAVELAPHWTLPRTHLAQAYMRAGETQLALATSDAARALDPTLPDVRIELGTVLRARARMATHVAARNRTFFLITLGAAVVITFLTAGIGFATLALPIYRFTLFRTAAHQRDLAWRQVRELEGAASVQPQPALLAPAPPLASRADVLPAPNAPTVSAGVLPAFTAAEMDPWIPSDARYRRAGWALLLISLILAASGVVSIVASLTLPLDPPDVSLSSLLEDSILSLSGLACLAAAALVVAGALLVGAVAAFRRRRLGWGIAILIIGVLGIIGGLAPAYVMVVAYLVAMPSSPGKAALDSAHMLQAST